MADPFYNKTVTVWNKSTDGLWENETWIPTVIENVRLLVSRGNNIQNSGNVSADSARLHIMDGISIPDKPYIEPGEWRKLTLSEKEGCFTLETDEDSFFVEGDASEADVSQGDFFGYMKQNYTNCFKITSVDRFDIIPHYEVWGK